MWVFLNNAFLSIVAAPGDGRLLVRARFERDIERTFPGAKVRTTPDRDYRYRAVLPTIQVADAMARQVQRISYGNFKNSVKEPWRRTLWLRVWHIMEAEQHRLHPDRDALPAGQIDHPRNPQQARTAALAPTLFDGNQGKPTLALKSPPRRSLKKGQ